MSIYLFIYSYGFDFVISFSAYIWKKIAKTWIGDNQLNDTGYEGFPVWLLVKSATQRETETSEETAHDIKVGC